MTTFQDRIHVGSPHEEAVKDRLEKEGWTVQPWGQGLLTTEIRQALVGAPNLIMWRWIPDLIATRGNLLRLIDPKSDISTTPNFALEAAAWATHSFMRTLGLPIVYVWHDFTVNYPHGITPVMFRDGKGTRGSGTPFILIAKADQYPWHSAFPTLEAAAA